jgi:hypothetical protein
MQSTTKKPRPYQQRKEPMQIASGIDFASAYKTLVDAYMRTRAPALSGRTSFMEEKKNG